MRAPAEVHELSLHSTGDGFEHRSVRPDGAIKWADSQVFIGEAFAGGVIGLCAIDDGRRHVHLGPLRLGALYERSRTVVPLESGVTHVPGHGAA